MIPWVEKYTPKNIEDLVLTDKTYNIVKSFIEKRNITNMTLCSKNAGIGKTSIAKFISNSIIDSEDIMFINGSIDRSIDILRNDLKEFALAISLSGNKKIIIIDEADGLTSQAQAGLRGFIEEYQNICSFIFTCNEQKRIIEPILSRCPVLDITPRTIDEKKELAQKILKRVEFILNEENILFEKSAIIKLIKTYFPDIRKIINEIQKFALQGEIKLDMIQDNLLYNNDNDTETIIPILKSKDFVELRKWAHNNYNDSEIYDKLFNSLFEKIDPTFRSDFILCIGEYSYRHGLCQSTEINLVACLTKIMNKVTW